MMFSRIGSGGCLCFLLIACGLVGPSDVEVRLENASSTAFAEATLFTVDGSHTYLDLGPGEASPYLNVTMAYGIATTQVVVGADTIRLQVIDYVGEEPLGAGVLHVRHRPRTHRGAPYVPDAASPRGVLTRAVEPGLSSLHSRRRSTTLIR